MEDCKVMHEFSIWSWNLEGGSEALVMIAIA